MDDIENFKIAIRQSGASIDVFWNPYGSVSYIAIYTDNGIYKEFWYQTAKGIYHRRCREKNGGGLLNLAPSHYFGNWRLFEEFVGWAMEREDELARIQPSIK